MEVETRLPASATATHSTGSLMSGSSSPWTISNQLGRPRSQPIAVSTQRPLIPFSPPLKHAAPSASQSRNSRPRYAESSTAPTFDADDSGLSPLSVSKLSQHSPSALSFLDSVSSADADIATDSDLGISDGEAQYSPQVQPTEPSQLLSSQLSQAPRLLAPKPIKTIAFDYGGVTFTDGKSKASRYLQERYGYDQRIIFELMTSPQSWDLRRGRITSAQFWSWAQSVLPEGYSAEAIRTEWCNGYELDRSIIELIAELRPHYRIVSYTDGIPDRVTELESRYHFRHLFHAEVQSYERDAVKTDGAFARALLETAQCSPDEMVLIDDNFEETHHVRDLGIPVLLYRTGQADELRRELHARGVKVRLPSTPARDSGL